MFADLDVLDLFKERKIAKSFRGRELSQVFGVNILWGLMNWVGVPAEL